GEATKNNAGPLNVHVNINSFTGNTLFGLSNQMLATVDATNNWWGDADGPNTALNTFHPNNPAGQKVVGSNISIAPWLADGNDSNTDADAPGFQHLPASATAPVAPTTPDLDAA